MILKLRISKFIIFFYLITQSFALSEIVKEIEVKGNQRISTETIIMFSDVKINQSVDENKLNDVTKNLFDTNFFKNITVEIKSNILKINVIEFPIIENVNIKGIKAKKILEALNKSLSLKSRASFDDFLFYQDKENQKRWNKLYEKSIRPYIQIFFGC